ncbi:MAG: hypothetical protein ACYTEQ_05335 [Planctomycetota bacterium]|jgi:hypothetical protein
MNVHVDLTTASVVIAWTVAVVSGIRKNIPKIDGRWVALITLPVAMLITFGIVNEADIWMLTRYAILGWAGAVGGVSFVDRVSEKVRLK